MGKRKHTRFKSKELRGTGEIADFLRHLADKLEENQVVLRQGEEVAKVDVPDNVVFKLKVKEKVKKRKTKHSFKITLKWDNGATGKPVILD